MNNLKPHIKKIFSVKNLLITLLFAFIVLFVIMIVFIISIYFDQTPSLSLTSKGIQTFFEIYKIPIAIAASLLAIATLAVTTLRTINSDTQIMEMRAQREASYQPDIVLSQGKLFIFSGTKDTYRSPDQSNPHPVRELESYLKIYDKPDSNESPFILMHNIGRGVAKNFRYKFLYDVNACIKIMNDFKVNDFFIMIPDKNSIEISTKSAPQARFRGNFPNEEWNSKIDFILPISGNPSPAKIFLPHLYVLLNFFKDELHLHSKREFRDHNNILNLFPKLFFDCEYLDIGLKHHKKKFEINVTFNFFNQLLDNDLRFNKITYEYDIVAVELKK